MCITTELLPLFFPGVLTSRVPALYRTPCSRQQSSGLLWNLGTRRSHSLVYFASYKQHTSTQTRFSSFLKEFLNKFLSSRYAGGVFMDSLPTSEHLGLSCCSKLHQIHSEFFSPLPEVVYLLSFRSTPHITKLHSIIHVWFVYFLFPDVVCNHCDITKSANKVNIFFVFSLQHYKFTAGIHIKRHLCNIYVTGLVLEHSYTESFLRSLYIK